MKALNYKNYEILPKFEIYLEISWEFLSCNWQYCSNGLCALPAASWISFRFRWVPQDVKTYFRGPAMGKRLGKIGLVRHSGRPWWASLRTGGYQSANRTKYSPYEAGIPTARWWSSVTEVLRPAVNQAYKQNNPFLCSSAPLSYETLHFLWDISVSQSCSKCDVSVDRRTCELPPVNGEGCLFVARLLQKTFAYKRRCLGDC